MDELNEYAQEINVDMIKDGKIAPPEEWMWSEEHPHGKVLKLDKCLLPRCSTLIKAAQGQDVKAIIEWFEKSQDGLTKCSWGCKRLFWGDAHDGTPLYQQRCEIGAHVDASVPEDNHAFGGGFSDGEHWCDLCCVTALQEKLDVVASVFPGMWESKVLYTPITCLCGSC